MILTIYMIGTIVMDQESTSSFATIFWLLALPAICAGAIVLSFLFTMDLSSREAREGGAGIAFILFTPIIWLGLLGTVISIFTNLRKQPLKYQATLTGLLILDVILAITVAIILRL